MSQLFDTLRRGSRTGRSAAAGSAGSARADAVLATLGFDAAPSRPTSRILIGTLAVVSIAGAWYAWEWYTEPVIRPAAGTVRQGAGRPSPPREPAHPALVQTPAPVEQQTRAPASGPPATVSHEVEPPQAAQSPRTSSSGRAPRPEAEATFSAALRAQQSGDVTAAIALYRAVLKNEPAHAFAHNNLGLLYQQQGDPAAAIREFRLALEADPTYLKARNNLGVAWLGQGKPDEAAAAFRAVLADNPRDVDALVNLALADRAAGRLEIAKETLLRALVIDPSHPAAHYNLAVLYEQSAEPGRAIAHYRAFLDHAGREHDGRAGDVRARVDLLLQRSAGS